MQSNDAIIEGFDLATFVADRVAERVHVAAGEVLFFKGDAAGGMFVVLGGRIDVIVVGKLLDRIGGGGILGEMALIDGTDRCAAALVQEAAELVALDRARFLDLIAEEPRFALAAITIMAKRIAGLSRLFPRPSPSAGLPAS